MLIAWQPGYAAIPYYAFSVKEDDSTPASQAVQPTELLQTVEALLREKRCHVIADTTKCIIWMFTNVDLTRDLGDQFGPPRIDGYILTRTLVNSPTLEPSVLIGV